MCSLDQSTYIFLLALCLSFFFIISTSLTKTLTCMKVEQTCSYVTLNSCCSTAIILTASTRHMRTAPLPTRAHLH